MTVSLFKKDYFTLLDLPITYQVDKHALQANYKSLQRLVHPDRYANKSEVEKRLALQAAAHVNQAYQTIKHPIKRAVYFLSLQGLVVDFEKNTRMTPEFLEMQIGWREVFDHDKPQVIAAIERARQARQTTLEALLAEPSESEQVITLITELQFIDKLQRDLLRK